MIGAEQNAWLGVNMGAFGGGVSSDGSQQQQQQPNQQQQQQMQIHQQAAAAGSSLNVAPSSMAPAASIFNPAMLALQQQQQATMQQQQQQPSSQPWQQTNFLGHIFHPLAQQQQQQQYSFSNGAANNFNLNPQQQQQPWDVSGFPGVSYGGGSSPLRTTFGGTPGTSNQQQQPSSQPWQQKNFLGHIFHPLAQQQQQYGFGSSAANSLNLKPQPPQQQQLEQHHLDLEPRPLASPRLTTFGQHRDAWGKYLGHVLNIPLPTDFATLASPRGPLQPTAAWRLFEHGANSFENAHAEYEARLAAPHVTGTSAAIERSKLPFWKSHITEVKFVYGAAALETRFQHIIHATIDPALLQPHPSLFSLDGYVCPITEPVIVVKPNGQQDMLPLDCYTERWRREEDLQRWLDRTSAAVANCLLKISVRGEGADAMLEYVRKATHLHESLYGKAPIPYDVKHGLSDFYLLSGSKRAPRASIVLDVHPFLPIDFILFALECLRLYVAGDATVVFMWEDAEAPDRTSESAPQWHNYASARSFILKLLNQLGASGAPMCVVCTGHQLVVIERTGTGDDLKFNLDIHAVVFQQPGPVALDEPAAAEAQNLRQGWEFCNSRNFPAYLVLLALLARSLPHWCSVQNYDAAPPTPLTQDETGTSEAPTQASSTSTTTGANDRSGKLSTSHTLLRQCNPFASGSASDVSYACLVPPGEPRCAHLALYTSSSCVPCTSANHVRAVAKIPRITASGAEYTSPCGASQEREESLRKEARLYESLPQLQGCVLPLFYGVWKAEHGASWVYEDVGNSLANVKHMRSLNLTASEIEGIGVLFKDLLRQLHAAGLAHGDVAARNLCLRRRTSNSLLHSTGSLNSTQVSAGQDLLSHSLASFDCRLVDLSEARELCHLSFEQRFGWMKCDLQRLDDVIADLVEHLQATTTAV